MFKRLAFFLFLSSSLSGASWFVLREFSKNSVYRMAAIEVWDKEDSFKTARIFKSLRWNSSLGFLLGASSVTLSMSLLPKEEKKRIAEKILKRIEEEELVIAVKGELDEQ